MITCSVFISPGGETELNKTTFVFPLIKRKRCGEVVCYQSVREGGMVNKKLSRKSFSASQSFSLHGKFTVEGAALSAVTWDSFNGEERAVHAESHRRVSSSEGRVSTSEMRSQ